MSAPESVVDLPDRYRVTSHIANGGMAAVWAAEDLTLGRLVAVKLLAPQFVGERSAVERFEREARTAASLSSHPHVVTIYDVAEHAGRPFIVMEHFSGGTVSDALRNTEVPPERALEWLAQAAGALDLAHDRGIVHRDVKPANMLLDERHRLALGDFGIARVAFDTSVTNTGQILGTAAYLAPEQAEGKPAVPASDRYALAVVAYELITGARPFNAGHFAAQARQHIEDEPDRPSERMDGLSPEVDEVLLRGLSKAPDERPGTARELVEGLRRAVRSSTVGAPTEATRPMGTRDAAAGAAVAAGAAGGAAAASASAPAEPRSRRTPRPAATPPPPPPKRPATPPPGPDPSEQGPGRRSRARVFALATIGALLLAVIAVAALSGGNDEPRPATDRTQASEPRESTERTEPTTSQPTRSETTPTTTQEPARTEAAAPSGNASQLNDRGFALMNQGNYAQAIPLLQQAVKDCPVEQTSPCAFAYYNLGRALRLGGRPAEAIPVLEKRLQNSNQSGAVQQELALARAAAGQGSGGQE